MFTLTLLDDPTAPPAHESEHSTVHDASAQLEAILAQAGHGDIAHPVLEYRGPAEAEFVIYDESNTPRGRATIMRTDAHAFA
ncbi:hypothetical protein ACWEQ4_01490 [Rhodococcus sp. NPDC003994]